MGLARFTFYFLLLVCAGNSFAQELDASFFRLEHCIPQSMADNSLNSYTSKYERNDESDYQAYPLAVMDLLFQDIYQNGQRMRRRVYFHPERKQFVTDKELFTSQGSQIVTLEVPLPFLRNIAQHLNEAIKQKFAQYIFFPDMGHGHFHVPENSGYEKLDTISQFEKALQDPQTRILYHTAEILDLFPKHTDRAEFFRFRYLHRNIIGDNKQGNIQIAIHSTTIDPINTVRNIPAYKELPQAGLGMQAHKDACFRYRDENGIERYFDIRL